MEIKQKRKDFVPMPGKFQSSLGPSGHTRVCSFLLCCACNSAFRGKNNSIIESERTGKVLTLKTQQKESILLCKREEVSHCSARAVISSPGGVGASSGNKVFYREV